jgi:coproporphyrinogen III oxidase
MIEVPLALPRRVEIWQYDVVGEELLRLPFAEVPTMHVKPRRVAKPGGDMTAQMWFAPGLQYLPVRILIHQDAQTFVDLTLQRPPQQSAQR